MSENKKTTENLGSSVGSSIGPQRGPSSPARVESQSKAIRRELAAMDAEPAFICSRCGTVTFESERSTGTTECMYC